jgi:hypothetical protein
LVCPDAPHRPNYTTGHHISGRRNDKLFFFYLPYYYTRVPIINTLVFKKVPIINTQLVLQKCCLKLF